MAVLSFPHDGQYGFDDVDVGEEVGLKRVLHESECPITLRQLFYGTNDSWKSSVDSRKKNLEGDHPPSLVLPSKTSTRPKASTASATAA
jgi:hypothetical protein